MSIWWLLRDRALDDPNDEIYQREDAAEATYRGDKNMSAIVHRCTTCGHNHIEHTKFAGRDICSYGGWCPCGKPEFGPSELIPTFDIAGNHVVDVFEPGRRVHQWAVMCSCGDCSALYESLLAGVA